MEEKIYAHFRLQYAVLVLNTAYVILGGYEQMNKLLRNSIKGELSIWSKERQNCASCYARAHMWHIRVHLPVQTCGSMFIDLNLCYYGLLAYNFPERKCLLLCSQFHPTA